MTATEPAIDTKASRFGARKPRLAELAGIFAIAGCGLLASILIALDDRVLPPGVAGLVLLAYGIITTMRSAVIVGFGLMGVTVVIAMSSIDPVLALLVTAPAAVILVGLVPSVDLAFTSRRETVMHPTLVPGMVRMHIIAALAGSGWALTVVAMLVLVEWPSTAITATMAALAAVAVVSAVFAVRSARRVHAGVDATAALAAPGKPA